MAKATTKEINRGGNYVGYADFHPIELNPTSGSPIGTLGKDKLINGLKKGAAGMPSIKSR